MVTAQKVGATVFLVPADNCEEARTVSGNTMELIKSENLQQTIEALETLTSGGKPPVC
jgi:PDZ domain-containing protein